MELKERFLKYVGFDTQSDPESETYPSTAKQLILLNYLAEEMKELGLKSMPMVMRWVLFRQLPGMKTGR